MVKLMVRGNKATVSFYDCESNYYFGSPILDHTWEVKQGVVRLFLRTSGTTWNILIKQIVDDIGENFTIEKF